MLKINTPKLPQPKKSPKGVYTSLQRKYKTDFGEQIIITSNQFGEIFIYHSDYKDKFMPIGDFLTDIILDEQEVGFIADFLKIKCNLFTHVGQKKI